MQTDSKAYVTHSDGTTDSYNAEEWNNYIKRPGDKFNFDEFFKIDYLINPREIKSQVDLLKKFVNLKYDVWILTNRENTNPIKRHFNRFSINVYGTGTAESIAKKKWIIDKIKEGYTDIEFFDDSIHNIDMVNSIKSEYPDIKIKTNLIKND